MQRNRGQWIQTYTGIHFHLLDPRPEEVSKEDIAHSLSQNCRFTGHTKIFYSVATHSILCAEQARKDGMSARIQLLLMLHDATETYLTDVSRPLKSVLGKIYTDLEDKVATVVWQHFDIEEPTEEEWKTIKHYDDFLLANEIGQLMINPEDFDIEPIYNGVYIPNLGIVHTKNRFLEILDILLKEYKEELENE